MNLKKPLLVIVLLAVVLALAFAPAALAKGQTVAASGIWTFEINEDDLTVKLSPPQVLTPSWKFHEFAKGSETGWWTGTFLASGTYEPFSMGYTIVLDPNVPEPISQVFWAHQLVYFKGVAVDMGGAEPVVGDMTMRVEFRADTCWEGGTWKIINGTGDLKHLGGEGTVEWTVNPWEMAYSGTICLNK